MQGESYIKYLIPVAVGKVRVTVLAYSVVIVYAEQMTNSSEEVGHLRTINKTISKNKVFDLRVPRVLAIAFDHF